MVGNNRFDGRGWASDRWLAAAQGPASPRRLFRLRLRNPDAAPLLFQPGQYLKLSFPGRGLLARSRPFTIASAPTETEYLDFYIKDQGDWTGALKSLLYSGDAHDPLFARIDGPYGKFSYRLAPDSERLVFIAAGLGAVPFLSMVRFMADADGRRRVLFLWGARTHEDLFAQDDFAWAARRLPGLRIIPCLTHDPLWTGETGRIDAERLNRFIPAFFGIPADGFAWDSVHYWISAPPRAAAEIKRGLRRSGAPRGALHIERRRQWITRPILPA